MAKKSPILGGIFQRRSIDLLKKCMLFEEEVFLFTNEIASLEWRKTKYYKQWQIPSQKWRS